MVESPPRAGTKVPPHACEFLYLIGQLTAGGSERQLYLLLRTLDRGRHPCAVVAWNQHPDAVFAERLRALGVPVLGLAGAPLAKLARLRMLAKRLRPAVVHSFSFHLNIAAQVGARGAGAVGVGSIRGEFVEARRRAGPFLGAVSSRWPRLQVCNSATALAQAAAAKGPFAPRRVVHIPNGVDLGTSRPDPSRSRENLVLGLGAIVPGKRWDLLLDAAMILHQQGFRFKVVVAGDGPLRASLQERARAMGLGGHVLFPGVTGDAERELTRATLLVHPSDTEGSPNAVLEALAAARPVVVTDAGDARGLVEDGVEGFVVPRGDAASLALAIASILEDPGRGAKMGEQGRLRAEREFGLEPLVERTLAAYREAGWRER